MTFEDITSAPLPTLLAAYRAAAAQHGDATEAGDHRRANQAAELLGSLYAEIRRRGADSQRAILPFLSDPSPGVRLWSASHALEFDSNSGEAVLRELVAVGRFLGLSAEVTLKEWRAGRLTFP